MKAFLLLLFSLLVVYAVGTGLDELIYVDLTQVGQFAAGFCITVMVLAILLIISSLG